MEWISVLERLPDELNNVLVFINDGRNLEDPDEQNLGHSIAYYLENNWCGGVAISEKYPCIQIFYADGGKSSIESKYVTHWMPMPQPPKE